MFIFVLRRSKKSSSKEEWEDDFDGMDILPFFTKLFFAEKQTNSFQFTSRTAILGPHGGFGPQQIVSFFLYMRTFLVEALHLTIEETNAYAASLSTWLSWSKKLETSANFRFGNVFAS